VEVKVEMSDADLLARLRDAEDHFVERKTVSDLNDCAKTVVAFANSAPVGWPCVLYVGVRDDGRFEEREIDFDSIQKSINKKLGDIYPRVAYFPKIISDGTKRALAIIVPGSLLRPHFAGPSYIRVGSESKVASEQQYDNLIAQRNSKVYRISKYIDKPVSVEIKWERGNRTFSRGTRNDMKVMECNESWVTLTTLDGTSKEAYPLNDIELSYDYDHGKNRLKIHLTMISD